MCGHKVLPGEVCCPEEATEIEVATAPTVKSDPLVGMRLGEYSVLERIGMGGIGIVYKAVQPVIEKTVAVKVLRPEVADDPEQIRRLLAEARLVASIKHRGIIDIFGFGNLEDGRQYLVMEYLDGSALEEVISRQAPMPAREAISILDDVLAALDAAHRAGVVHRDLKPSNIFVVSQPDGTQYAKVLDFGLAKGNLLWGGSKTPQSRVLGTPRYMAPEQARGTAASPRSDLYAVGVIAFEMLTGRMPFDAPTFYELVKRQMEHMAPMPSSFHGGIPSSLDQVVSKLLERNPSARPGSASQVRAELTRVRKELMGTETKVVTDHSAETVDEDPEKIFPAAARTTAQSAIGRSARRVAFVAVAVVGLLLLVGTVLGLRGGRAAGRGAVKAPEPEHQAAQTPVAPQPSDQESAKAPSMPAPKPEGAVPGVPGWDASLARRIERLERRLKAGQLSERQHAAELVFLKRAREKVGAASSEKARREAEQYVATIEARAPSWSTSAKGPSPRRGSRLDRR
ncbi:MAG: serine/threonine protein kinase [Myxococcales bacterium]|nr:serine/threonine protein kinase [Myxococcales bacterium]